MYLIVSLPGRSREYCVFRVLGALENSGQGVLGVLASTGRPDPKIGS